ncbi:Uncharacterized protein FWK35_00027744, partial [Aphis craccivora]
MNSNTSEPEDFENDCENLNLTIALWALRYRISHKALSELLKSLKKLTSFSTKYLPKDALELLLQNDNKNKTPKTLLLVDGIDGLPLTTNPPRAYFGKNKPSDSNSFLLQFVNEMNELFYTGVTYNNNHVNIILHALVCDTPAKSFVLNTKGHNGKNAYCPIRSHQILLFHMIIDYIYLNCIGVLKKTFIVLVTVIDNKFKFLSSYIPVEFQRKTNEYSRMHPLRDVNRWKASELRHCLLYTGIVVFQNIVKKEVYNHCVVLSVAIRILLAEDVKKYGSLERISAFPFENFMLPLKRDRRAYTLNINQTRFCKEGPINAVCQSDRPLISGTGFPHYTSWHFECFTVKINSADNCIKLKNGSIIITENIATLKENNETVIGRRL